jgi:glycosyltransferase involved in cell wall biosynthesis
MQLAGRPGWPMATGPWPLATDGTPLARPQRVRADLIPVAVILSSFEPGGTERQMTELIRRLDRDRFRVHAVCFRRTGAWLPRVEAAAYEVADFPLRSFKSAASIPPLLRFVAWLRRRKIAVVHACDLYANIFALPGAALARVPVRIGSRRELAPPDKTRAHLTAQRLAYRFAHRVVANSTAAAARIASEGVPDARISVIPNGIDLSAFTPAPARDRRRIVATVANLRQEKGHDVLLRAAAIVLQQVPDARFRIIGDGPMRGALLDLAAALGVAPAVEFLGHREDVASLLAASDLYAFPSRTEAFPNGLIEGMAAALPVIASGVGGMLELVEHQRNGLLVPPDDEAALARAILDLMGDETTAAMLAQTARQTIESRYSFERMVAAFEQLYLSELAVSRFGAGAARAALVS